MDSFEKATLKAACIQAAAILIGAQPAPVASGAGPPVFGRSASGGPDTAACARFARDLFGKVTGESWD
jgi:hypothetical protein